MKNKVLLIIIVFIVIFAIAIYGVYTYRTNVYELQKINNEYESYYNTDISGTDLVSLINKTADINEKNGISKGEDGLYIEDDEKSIKIYICVKYDDEYRTIEMEKIIENGVENFIKVYSTATFKCTDISYHNKTGFVEGLTFTETDE